MGRYAAYVLVWYIVTQKLVYYALMSIAHFAEKVVLRRTVLETSAIPTSNIPVAGCTRGESISCVKNRKK